MILNTRQYEDQPLRPTFLLLGVAERQHIARHVLVAVRIIAALHFRGAKSASVVVNGDIGPVYPGIDTNLFCLDGLACGQAAGGHLRLFQNTVPEFCIWRRQIPMPESFACAVTGAAKRKAIMNSP